MDSLARTHLIENALNRCGACKEIFICSCRTFFQILKIVFVSSVISIVTNCVFIARGWVLNPLQGEYWEILPLGTGLVNATPLARMHA